MRQHHTRSLATLLADRASETPHAAALSSSSSQNGELSYGDLADNCARRAASLARLDLPEGCIVALAASADVLAHTLLACQWVGHPFLPLDPATAALRWPALGAAGTLPIYRLAESPTAQGSAAPPSPSLPAPDTPALVIATSGSEGAAKGVLLAHSALDAAATASNARIPLAAGDIWLNCLPLHHIGGLSIFWRCFMAAATVRLHDGFNAEKVWHEIADGTASHISLVPAMLSRLLDVAAGAAPPPRLRCVLVGGAALSQPLWQRARAAGWPLYVSYGMSETAAQISVLPPNHDWYEGRVGQPLPGNEIRIDDSGRICMRGPQRMLGYLGQSVLAAGEWWTTGDLGEIDANGQLTVLGRADDLLVSGGVNLHPTEIEGRLAACPGVLDCAVAGTPDPVWGDVVTALVVGDIAPETLANWCREHLPTAMRPRRFVRAASLPRNGMGKLERRRLNELLDGKTGGAA